MKITQTDQLRSRLSLLRSLRATSQRMEKDPLLSKLVASLSPVNDLSKQITMTIREMRGIVPDVDRIVGVLFDLAQELYDPQDPKNHYNYGFFLARVVMATLARMPEGYGRETLKHFYSTYYSVPSDEAKRGATAAGDMTGGNMPVDYGISRREITEVTKSSADLEWEQNVREAWDMNRGEMLRYADEICRRNGIWNKR